MSGIPTKWRRLFRPHLESLENRHAPAQFGVPWTDPAHLTVSFAPDGTSIAGEPSRLAASLDSQLPRSVWEDAILQAFQTWAAVANVNIGLVPDGGQPFGHAGATQADARFGDIRVGGLPLSAESLAVSIPPATFVSGTFAGDMVINTAAAHSAGSLFAVALHEAGHALGLPHSTDPRSVMFSHLNQNTTLTAGDVAAVRALYGPRAADFNEGSKGNDTFKNATRIRYSALSGGYDGSTPLVVYGDITTRTDADVFFLKGLAGYTGPVSFRIQTTGISLLAPQMTLYDRAGRVLAQTRAEGTRGDVLTLTLPATVPDAVYYIKIEAAPGAVTAFGRYSLAATFDDLLQPTAVPLDSVMRGPYETLSPEEQDLLFKNPDSVLFGDDLHTNDTAGLATNLRPGPGQPSELHLQTTASLGDASDVDFYRVKTPTTKHPWVVTVSTRASGENGITPRLEVLDGNLNPVPSRVIVNGNGTYTVQAVGIAPKANIFLRVFSPDGAGNYTLDVAFGTAAAELGTLAANTLAAASSEAGYALYVGQTQLFSLGLTANGPTGSVRMEILNTAGVVVFSLEAGVGETATAISTVLAPGAYTVRFTTTGGPVTFSVQGTGISDPIGPVADSTTLAPQYQAPQDPSSFLYPDGTLTHDAFLWAFLFTI